MPNRRDARFDLRPLLDAVQKAPPISAVEVLAGELARLIGAEDVSFLIPDFSGNALIRFLTTPPGDPERDDADALVTVPLDGSEYERAIRTQRVCAKQDRQWTRLFVPVSDRGDAVGVLEAALPGSPDDDVVEFVAAAAHALAYVVIANRRHTDVFERGQRNEPFSLAAEIQRRLLPPSFTCEEAAFTVAGWLEPASQVGGDTFDYSVERDELHLSITDAMGHTVNASQLATLAVSSLRNVRRRQGSVVEQAQAANTALTDHAGEEDFVSGLLLRVNLATGGVAAVNAGHPPSYLVRDGHVRPVAFEADLPFGVLPGTVYREQPLVLQPGDRLVLVTDGMLERNASSLDISSALASMDGVHPREVVHTFARAVISETGGALQDDATVLCLDWHGTAGAGVTSADGQPDWAGLLGRG